MRIESVNSATTFIPRIFRDNRITQIAIQSMRLLPRVSGKTLGIATVLVFSVLIIAQYFAGKVPRNIISNEKAESLTQFEPEVINALLRLPQCQHANNILVYLAKSNFSTIFFEEGDGGFEELYSSFETNAKEITVKVVSDKGISDKIANEIGVVDNSLILMVFKDKEAEGHYCGLSAILGAQPRFEALSKKYGSRLRYYELSTADYRWMKATGFCPLKMYRLFLELKKQDNLLKKN